MDTAHLDAYRADLVVRAGARRDSRLIGAAAQDLAGPRNRLHQGTSHLGPIYDRLGLFNVYTSPWFSAIYLLLFVSLVGCIIPRIGVYAKALRARPPKTPRNLAGCPRTRRRRSPIAIMKYSTVLRQPCATALSR